MKLTCEDVRPEVTMSAIKNATLLTIEMYISDICIKTAADGMKWILYTSIMHVL
jgi:hypothetical protein